MEEEIDEDKYVHEKDKEKDDHPAFGYVADATRSVLLGFD